MLTSDWEENSPDRLVDLAARACLNDYTTFCTDHQLQEDDSQDDEDDDEVEIMDGTRRRRRRKKWKIRDGVQLPTEICERLLYALHRYEMPIDDAFLALFQDTRKTRLRRVNFYGSSNVSDKGVSHVLQHNLVELDIHHCQQITRKMLDEINNHSSRLLSLNIGDAVHILPEQLAAEEDEDLPQDAQLVRSRYYQQGYILNAPNLKRLVIKDFTSPVENDYFAFLIRPLTNLTYLDLSGCYSLGDLEYLSPLKNLQSLILFNTLRLSDAAVSSICHLTSLRHLDISQHNEKREMFRNPNKVLTRIARSLTHLSYLDISGTNLAGLNIAESDMLDENVKESGESTAEQAPTDIPGLRCRASRPLEFLGLLNTYWDASHRYHIPAKRIAGDANERQILTAAQAYLDRHEFLQRVLNDLFRIFRFETCHNTKLALQLILAAMTRHLTEKHIQISGSASLFYIVKGEEKHHLNIKVKRLIIKAILDAMSEHKTDATMMRNGCLTLCHFKIPQDVLFDYKRLVYLLLHIVAQEPQEEFVQRIGIYLLNSLACQVDGLQKQLVGDAGAIETMLKIIEVRLTQDLCDEVMEIAWSTMWNVTDETAVNCRRFLEGGGMELFLSCLRAFPDKPELLRNMMGLLGNVAEVQLLRPKLMLESYIRKFSDLLESTSDGIEVSYNAAGVLSHIASDGPEFWTIRKPARTEVLDRMVNAIERWDITTKRNINYRSFEPILRLLKVEHTPQAQHWAVWALANLTRVYPEKYCSLVEEEGGLELLKDLIARPSSYARIQELAQLVLSHCDRYRSVGTLDDLTSDARSDQEGDDTSQDEDL